MADLISMNGLDDLKSKTSPLPSAGCNCLLFFAPVFFSRKKNSSSFVRSHLNSFNWLPVAFCRCQLPESPSLGLAQRNRYPTKVLYFHQPFPSKTVAAFLSPCAHNGLPFSARISRRNLVHCAANSSRLPSVPDPILMEMICPTAQPMTASFLYSELVSPAEIICLQIDRLGGRPTD